MCLFVGFNGSETFRTRVFGIQAIKSMVNEMKAEISSSAQLSIFKMMMD